MTEEHMKLLFGSICCHAGEIYETYLPQIQE